MTPDSPWLPILIVLSGLAAGVGLAYVVTRPKSPEQIAHEVLLHEAAYKHARRLRKNMARTR